ncbi:uncharacterized protein BX664DRAFT_323405 [Halteromyces radiatus]|uniref:uncharacterized protein n=1 Tax=Halteromyces radiatus TaxID=101107 RepID=UPI00221F5C67|nr:uncharacterized protein BX664DRAFT_323405 [Halteromyces radiatus]KAI8096218.1 hypothetical protein BX664DRAFT_323405 [Halteromyces radiatus]
MIVIQRLTIVLCIYLFVCVTITNGANCFCKKIPKLFTADCCQGCHGELRTNGDLHCHFDDYAFMADFNRCCDSFYGMARCTLG